MTAKAAPTANADAKSTVPVTRGDDLAERLAEDISESVFAPGCRLDEVRLAARYGTSRTPVREALRQLEAFGLIERRPYRGAIVSAPSPQHLAEMRAAAAEVEASCARLAATNMTAAERAALRDAQDKMSETAHAGSSEAFKDADAAFHECLYVGAHNATIAGFARDLRRRLKPFRVAEAPSASRLERRAAEHQEVARAIENGRAEEAASLMRAQQLNIEPVEADRKAS